MSAAEWKEGAKPRAKMRRTRDEYRKEGWASQKWPEPRRHATRKNSLYVCQRWPPVRATEKAERKLKSHSPERACHHQPEPECQPCLEMPENQPPIHTDHCLVDWDRHGERPAYHCHYQGEFDSLVEKSLSRWDTSAKPWRHTVGRNHTNKEQPQTPEKRNIDDDTWNCPTNQPTN